VARLDATPLRSYGPPMPFEDAPDNGAIFREHVVTVVIPPA
jgi:hypothetical protein